MQPSNPLQSKISSFSKPEVKSQPVINSQEPNTNEPVNTAAPTTPVEDSATDEAKEAQDREKVVKKAINTISKELGTSLSTDDLKQYILKGRVSKEVSVIEGLIKGTFQTLKIEDLQNIDMRMAVIRDEAKLTPKGIENEEAIIALSYAWTHADGKPLGMTAADREAVIRRMGSLFIERASNARVNFDTLLRLSMQERSLVKK